MPFKLEEISGLLRAHCNFQSELNYPSYSDRLTVAHFPSDLSNLPSSDVEQLQKTAKETVEALNRVAAENGRPLTLDSSTGLRQLGGTCGPEETGFAGVLRRYFRETFFESVLAWTDTTTDVLAWTGRITGERSAFLKALVVESLGVRHRHRCMVRTEGDIGGSFYNWGLGGACDDSRAESSSAGRPDLYVFSAKFL